MLCASADEVYVPDEWAMKILTQSGRAAAAGDEFVVPSDGEGWKAAGSTPGALLLPIYNVFHRRTWRRRGLSAIAAAIGAWDPPGHFEELNVDTLT